MFVLPENLADLRYFQVYVDYVREPLLFFIKIFFTGLGINLMVMARILY